MLTAREIPTTTPGPILTALHSACEDFVTAWVSTLPPAPIARLAAAETFVVMTLGRPLTAQVVLEAPTGEQRTACRVVGRDVPPGLAETVGQFVEAAVAELPERSRRHLAVAQRAGATLAVIVCPDGGTAALLLEVPGQEPRLLAILADQVAETVH